MSSAATGPSQFSVSDELLQKLNRRTKRLSIVVWMLVLCIASSLVGSLFLVRRQLAAIEKARKDLAFSQFVSDYDNREDFVTPTVNVIQFLRRGYSVTFDKVEYTQNGLELSGQIGNPTQIWISSLALNFSARPYPYKIRDKWEKGQEDPNFLIWWDSDWTIGTAQTTVGSLNPGSTSYFNVTIPNVKQTSDAIQIAVSFSGERYVYLGK